MPKGDATYPTMTIDECLAFADEWSRGITLYPGAQGWRVVCMLLAKEVRAMREKVEQLERGEYICKKCGLRKDDEHPRGGFLMAEKEGCLNTNAHLEAKVVMLMAQLAESQAREQKMRARIERHQRLPWCRVEDVHDNDSILTQMGAKRGDMLYLKLPVDAPQDDSALREMIEAAKAEEREAIIAEMPGGHSVDPQWVCDMIRARGGE